MRCSSLPLAAKCRASAKLNGGYGNEPANVGTAFHVLARCKVLNQPLEFDSVALRFGLSRQQREDVERSLNNIGINIPNGAIIIADDQKLESAEIGIAGHPDLGVIYEKLATVVDWKSGWNDVEDPETNYQLLGYAILIMLQFPDVATFDLIVVMPKLNVIKAARFTREKLTRIAEDIKAIVKESESEDAQFSTGGHCHGCFKSMNCPAFAGEVVRFHRMIHSDVSVPVKTIEENLRVLLPFAKSMKIVADKVEEVAKSWVERNGPLDLGNGLSYVSTVEERDQIDSKKALPILTEYFGDDAIALAAFSKTSIKDAAVEKERGLSGKILKRLEVADAITKKTIVKYVIKKGVNHEQTSNIAGSAGQIGSQESGS